MVMKAHLFRLIPTFIFNAKRFRIPFCVLCVPLFVQLCGVAKKGFRLGIIFTGYYQLHLMFIPFHAVMEAKIVSLCTKSKIMCKSVPPRNCSQTQANCGTFWEKISDLVTIGIQLFYAICLQKCFCFRKSFYVYLDLFYCISGLLLYFTGNEGSK